MSNSSITFVRRSVLCTMATAALASAFLVPTAQAAEPSGTGGCTSTVTGFLAGAQTVSTGEKLCLRGASVGGAITVEPGGALDARNSSIDGAVTLAGAKGFTFCASATTGGALSVSGTTGVVRIGDNKNCDGNSVDGAITLDGNLRAVKVAQNDVNGGVTLNANVSRKDANPIVSGNVISGDLSCTGNDPKPSERGRVNQVAGEKSGQCLFPS